MGIDHARIPRNIPPFEQAQSRARSPGCSQLQTTSGGEAFFQRESPASESSDTRDARPSLCELVWAKPTRPSRNSRPVLAARRTHPSAPGPRLAPGPLRRRRRLTRRSAASAAGGRCATVPRTRAHPAAAAIATRTAHSSRFGLVASSERKPPSQDQLPENESIPKYVAA